MAKEKMIEGEFKKEEPAAETPKAEPDVKSTQQSKPASDTFKEVVKQVEEFGHTIGGAISNRDNVVMVRVNAETLRKLDMLVDAEICKSRSESASYLINEGIKANGKLYEQIGKVTEKIAELRAQLRVNIQDELKKEK